jgi:hypothetical protein
MGMVVLTGFEMTRMWTVGETQPIAAARSRTMGALVLRDRISGDYHNGRLV